MRMCSFRPALHVSALVVLGFTSAGSAQPQCGDCNQDGAVDILDALVGSQHAVLISVLGPVAFQYCNVVGDLGGPFAPGNPTVDVLDIFAIAQYDAGLRPGLNCSSAPTLWSGPFDLRFGGVPATTISGQPFGVAVSLFVQGTPQPAIPSSPLLVTLSVDSGSGQLQGSVRQVVDSDVQMFDNLSYGPIEMYTLRCSAGAPNGDDVSSSINNLVAVEADLRGDTEGELPPYDLVRFNFRGDGVAVPLNGPTFDWQVTEIATGMVVHTGSVVTSGTTFVDATMPAMLNIGLHRIHGEIAGTAAHDDHALYIRSTGASKSLHVATLATGHIDFAYTDDISSYVSGTFSSFFLLGDQLPPGLALLPGPTGTISGRATAPGYWQLMAFGVDAIGDVTRVPLGIAIFSQGDTEIEPGVDFSQAGPYMTTDVDYPDSMSTFMFTNVWDCTVDDTRIRFYYPVDVASLSRLPAICFINDNGLRWNDYDRILEVVASYGYIVASGDNDGYATSPTCGPCGSGGGGVTFGFARSTGFQFAIYDALRDIDDGTLAGSPGWANDLIGKVDFDNVFWAGHGRGGATSLLSIMDGWRPHRARGAISIMGIDPKGQDCLGLPNTIPPVPVLSVSAERDGDVIFPIAENPMEDAVLSGMDTHVTIYGANHQYASDSDAAEAPATITRIEEQERIRHWMIAFLERHTRGDLRVEGQLYLDEHTSSGIYGVYGRRGTAGTVVVDDHQTGLLSENSLGGINSFVGLVADEVRSFPSIWEQGRSTVHRRLSFGSGGGANTWAAPAGRPVEGTSLSHVSFRARQYDCASGGCTGTSSWSSWISSLTIDVQDGVGTVASIDLTPLLSAPSTASSSQQRFHRFSVPFQQLVQANPAFDPSSLQLVRLRVVPITPTPTRWLAVDDVRFE